MNAIRLSSPQPDTEEGKHTDVHIFLHIFVFGMHLLDHDIRLFQQFEHNLSTFGIVCDLLTYASGTGNDIRFLRFKMTATQCAIFGPSNQTHSVRGTISNNPRRHILMI